MIYIFHNDYICYNGCEYFQIIKEGMPFMKKLFYFGILLISSVTIAGCSISIGNEPENKESSNNEQKSEQKNQDAKDDNNKEASKSGSDSNSKSDSKSDKKVTNISETQSVAMTLLEPEIDSKVITADELLSGSYTQKFGNGEEITDSVDKVELSESPELGKMKNKPDGMKFYGMSPSKGSYATIVGINKDQVVYIYTQSPISDYNDVKDSKTFTSFNIADLYNNHKDDSKVSELENKIEYGESLETKHDSSASQEDKNSNEYYAKVWLTALPNYKDSDNSSGTKPELNHESLEGEYLNPYNKENTIKYPKGVQRLAGVPTAAGNVVYKNNDDGTISIYDVPSHFHDREWLDDDEWSQKESESIMNNPKVMKLYEPSDEELQRVVEMFDGTTKEENKSEDIDEDDEKEEVTRENVIDKVEAYEGGKLNTDKYTIKEPEKNDDGEWGFSYLDKEGNLVGSYIIDEDGVVTEYDEDGVEVGSGE